MKYIYSLIMMALLSLCNPSLYAQDIEEADYGALEYRLVGPFRGGRSAAVTGVITTELEESVEQVEVTVTYFRDPIVFGRKWYQR